MSLATTLRARLALLLGRHAAAEAALDERLLADPTADGDRRRRALLRARRGDRDAALADLDALRAPRAADAFNRGFLLDALQRHEDAAGAFREALAHDDALDRAWYGLGLALQSLGRLDESRAAFERHVVLQPLNPVGWYRLAHLHARRGEREALARVIAHLKTFEPRVARQLERETDLRPAGRS